MRAACMVLVLAGCTLDPLVEDAPGASVHILPPGSQVPSIADNPDRVHQIEVHDGLDDGDLEEAGGVVLRAAGWADGAEVRFWPFGEITNTASLVYVLVEDTGDGPVPIADHPYLLDSIPGETGYSPVRRIQYLRVTDAYRGELLPSMRALADALDLGLVEEPEPAGLWLSAPVVPPGTRLEVGGGAEPVDAAAVFAAGYRVDVFLLGGELGVQPTTGGGSVPTGQLAVLAEGNSTRFADEPVMQWGIPAAPPEDKANYTPLCTVVEVRLADGVTAADIDADADLFVRSGSGAVTATTDAVASFEVTDTIRYWPIQFQEGLP